MKKRGRSWKPIFILCVLPTLFVVAAVACTFASANGWLKKTNPESSVVRIKVDDGFGSGVYLGHGLVLTADHVVRVGDGVTKAITVAAKYNGVILWRSPSYDLALVQADGNLKAPAAILDCSIPHVGAEITAIGSPLNLGMIASYGHVSSKAEKRGNVASAFIVNVALAPGNSGGGLFGRDGRLVGIADAISLMPIGQGLGAPVGFAYAVPISAFCHLTARN